MYQKMSCLQYNTAQCIASPSTYLGIPKQETRDSLVFNSRCAGGSVLQCNGQALSLPCILRPNNTSNWRFDLVGFRPVITCHRVVKPGEGDFGFRLVELVYQVVRFPRGFNSRAGYHLAQGMPGRIQNRTRYKRRGPHLITQQRQTRPERALGQPATSERTAHIAQQLLLAPPNDMFVMATKD